MKNSILFALWAALRTLTEGMNAQIVDLLATLDHFTFVLFGKGTTKIMRSSYRQVKEKHGPYRQVKN